MKLDFSVAVHSILYLDAHRDSKVAVGNSRSHCILTR